MTKLDLHDADGTIASVAPCLPIPGHAASLRAASDAGGVPRRGRRAAGPSITRGCSHPPRSGATYAAYVRTRRRGDQWGVLVRAV